MNKDEYIKLAKELLGENGSSLVLNEATLADYEIRDDLTGADLEASESILTAVHRLASCPVKMQYPDQSPFYHIKSLIKKLRSTRGQLASAREVIEFYSNSSNWEEDHNGKLLADDGFRAREWLEKNPPNRGSDS